MNRYSLLSKDEQEEHFSNYLIKSWSYSKVSTFSRNEKAFEMSYIYQEPFKRSSSEVAGSAYHKAQASFFLQFQKGIKVDIAWLQSVAFDYIDTVKPSDWKTQKTTPTIEECKKKAEKLTLCLLENFLKEVSVYIDDIAEVIAVELYIHDFITINGVEIPLPCSGVMDLVIKTKSKKIVIIDHKSKAAFTDEKELKFSIGKQGITYVLLFESQNEVAVDEVWFIENKYSENKNGAPQLNCFKVEITEDTRRLYEALLYEPVKRMIEAVSNPNYVYMINEADNYVDLAEVYEFWARTLICEIEDFPNASNKELIKMRLKKIRDASLGQINPSIIKKFRENAAEFITYDLTNKDMTPQEKIEHVLRTFGLSAKVGHTFDGYSSNTFLLEVQAGTQVSSVNKYKLDIASALSVESVRIMKNLYVHEGRSYLALESGKKREKFLEFSPEKLSGMKIPIGIDNMGNTVVWDLDNPSTPHVLICGSTGSGKSVCIMAIIDYARLAGINDIIICDPKHEFKGHSGKGVTVISEIEEIEKALKNEVETMNNIVKSGGSRKRMIIFDEFADAVAQSKSGNELNIYEEKQVGFYANGGTKTKLVKAGVEKSLEENLRILLQKGRSAGYRIIAATQRASTKVITGDAKVNFPVQICFKVPKEIDSMVVLDEPGAESLTGKGDGLIKSPEYSTVTRFQAFNKK